MVIEKQEKEKAMNEQKLMKRIFSILAKEKLISMQEEIELKELLEGEEK